MTGPAGPTGPSALGLVAVADGAGQALLLERCGAVVVRRDDGPPTAAEPAGRRPGGRRVGAGRGAAAGGAVGVRGGG
nr:hypothetical protein [Angustibacter aerolatus]